MCKHSFKYAGGRAKCVKCGKYLQPSGEVTSTPTGRTRKKSR
jgi:hypothetical protein